MNKSISYLTKLLMREGELVLLLGKKSFIVKVRQEKLNTEFGIIDLSKLKKKKFGETVKTHKGEEFVIVKPSVIDFLMKRARRAPQIITPKDASLILAHTGIPRDSLIVDCGTGSGFLSIFLAHYCSEGKVVTYEKNRKFVKIARKNIKESGLKNIILKVRDVLLEEIDERNVDLVTVDMEGAEKIVEKAYKILKPGGWLVVYSPYIEQVMLVRKEMKKFNFTEIKTIESNIREWRVGKHTLPEVSGILHTGWLTFARKIV